MRQRSKRKDADEDEEAKTGPEDVAVEEALAARVMCKSCCVM
jgi:hypothetical protein